VRRHSLPLKPITENDARDKQRELKKVLVQKKSESKDLAK